MTRPRRVAVGCASALVLVLALLGGAYAYLSRPDPRWASVASIEQEPTYQDDARLQRAWALPAASLYRPRFDSQGNGSFCGPTSVVDVVRSTGGDADQAHVLEGTDISTFFGFLPRGITLDQVAELVRTRLPDRTVTVHRDLDLDRLGSLVRRANDPDVRMIVNFHRGPLFGRGSGHHSPIGGYLEDEDLVFVLDVNETYHPWLVPTERLLEAVDTVDSATGHTRGIVVVE